MVILLSALLFGVTIACASWVIAQRVQNRGVFAQRLSSVTGDLNFPYAMPADPQADAKKNEIITLDTSYEDKLIRQLFLAGIRNRTSAFFYQLFLKLALALPILLFVVYALMGSMSVKNLILFGVAGGVLYVYVWMLIRALKQRRQKSILRILPQFFDLLVVCLEAGLNFSSALPRVLQDMSPSEPLVKEFDHMHRELMGGLTLPQACDRLSRRCEVPDLSVILISIIQSDQMGSGLASVLRVQAKELRDKHRQRMREKAYRIPIKLLFPMILIFMTLFTMTLGPAFLQLTIGTQSNSGARSTLRK